MAEVWLGQMARYTSHLDQALEDYGRAEKLLAGQQTGPALVDSLTIALLNTERFTEASQKGHRALALARAAGYVFGAVWAASHNPEAAAVLWGASRALSQAVGWTRVAIADNDRADTGSAFDSLFYTAPILAARAKLGPARSRAADQQGASMTFGTMLGFADVRPCRRRADLTRLALQAGLL